MKKIYIVLTHTGTALSRIIKTFTKDEFSHASISLDKELTEMYSFGRLNPYNPFIGGFVHESIYSGTFKRFKYTKTKIYSLDIEDEQYYRIKDLIDFIKEAKEMQKFNVIGLFAAGIHKKIKFVDSFYCAEFVKYAIEIAGIKTSLPDVIKPEDFKLLENIKLVYEGCLKDYNVEKIKLLEKLLNARKREAII